MLDWLRYFPWSFRYSNEPVCPKDPYFSKLRPITWYFADNRINFKAPRTNRFFDSSAFTLIPKSISPEQSDITFYELGSFCKDDMPNRHWQYHHFFYREWYFVGPWFTGKRAELSMFADVVGPSEETNSMTSKPLVWLVRLSRLGL